MKTLLLSMLFGVGLSAAGVSISTITCASQIVTVNATAHGIAQYQGFSIAGSSVATYNINSTAGTATTNSFTFTLPAGTSCNGSASGGTVLPAKQIIAVSMMPVGNGSVTIDYLCWYTTVLPTPLVCNLGTNGTSCPISAWPGASAAENAAIVAGTTVEVPGTVTFAATVPAATLSANLVAQYNAVQASYTTGFLGYAGYWWNGKAWVNQ